MKKFEKYVHLDLFLFDTSICILENYDIFSSSKVRKKTFLGMFRETTNFSVQFLGSEKNTYYKLMKEFFIIKYACIINEINYCSGIFIPDFSFLFKNLKIRFLVPP